MISERCAGVWPRERSASRVAGQPGFARTLRNLTNCSLERRVLPGLNIARRRGRTFPPRIGTVPSPEGCRTIRIDLGATVLWLSGFPGLPFPRIVVSRDVSAIALTLFLRPLRRECADGAGARGRTAGALERHRADVVCAPSRVRMHRRYCCVRGGATAPMYAGASAVQRQRPTAA